MTIRHLLVFPSISSDSCLDQPRQRRNSIRIARHSKRRHNYRRKERTMINRDILTQSPLNLRLIPNRRINASKRPKATRPIHARSQNPKVLAPSQP